MALVIPPNLKLVIFDLDDTLHKCHILSSLDNNIRKIINFFQLNGVDMAIASLNTMAHFFLWEYGIIDKFKCIEARKFSDECYSKKDAKIHSSGFKSHMFKSILDKTGIEKTAVLIFDDNPIHIMEAQRHGIHAVLVDPTKLLTWNNVAEGLRMFKPGCGKRVSCHF